MPPLCWTLSGSSVRDLSGLGDPTSNYATAGIAFSFTGACNPRCPPGRWSCLGSFIIKICDILMEAEIHIIIAWPVISCSLLGRYQLFEQPYYLHIQGDVQM
jgi:hypothetical protein